jgi:hypothetical protein
LNIDPHSDTLLPSLFVLAPDNVVPNVATPGQLIETDVLEVKYKKLTWAVGAVLYKMISGKDAPANYVHSTKIEPKNLYQSSKLLSLMLAVNLNRSRGSHTNVHSKAEDDLTAALKDAQKKLATLVQLMDIMLVPDANKRFRLDAIFANYNAKLFFASNPLNAKYKARLDIENRLSLATTK